jgi:hypothetical protein
LYYKSILEENKAPLSYMEILEIDEKKAIPKNSS